MPVSVQIEPGLRGHSIKVDGMLVKGVAAVDVTLRPTSCPVVRLLLPMPELRLDLEAAELDVALAESVPEPVARKLYEQLHVIYGK